jgi:putative hemolysin
MARPMLTLAWAAGPLVRLLGWCTDALLKVLPLKLDRQVEVTDEEVKGLMREGLRAGAFHRAESEMVSNVLELDQLVVRDIMTPRPKIISLNKDDSHEAIWHKIVVSRHSQFPVYEGSRDHVVGVVSVKAIYANLAAGVPVRLADLATKPLMVPEVQSVLKLLETFRQTGNHVALVSNEFGSITGIVTLIDVMEAVLGDMPAPGDRSRPEVRARPDGTWLADAMVEIERVEQALPGFRSDDPGNRDYQTLAGYLVKRLGRVPREGETVATGGYVFEILDMDNHRVDKVLVTKSSGLA